MRRSLLAGIGALVVLVFAACTDRPNDKAPLVPTGPSLAKGSTCGGSMAASIRGDIDDLFDAAQEAVLDPQFDAIDNACTSGVSNAMLLTFIQQVIDYRGTNITDARAQDLVDLWADVTNFATGAPLVRSYRVLRQGLIVNEAEGVRSGGADVLDGASTSPFYDLQLTTFDGQAGVQINDGQTPVGPHLVTMDPDPTQCPSTALNAASPACYNVQVYPPVTTWVPNIDVGMCIHGGGSSSTAISHVESASYTEVLPDSATFPWGGGTCHQTHTVMNTWLGREAGPLGRALAKAIDYLRPQPLLADDAGESGSTDASSPFGGVALKIIEDDMSDLGLTPDIGDAWTISAVHPGFIRINETGVGNMPGPLVELSQGQGACNQCPLFQLLATRENGNVAEDDGTYEVSFTSLQAASNLKEAPFVILNANAPGNNNANEIARLSYTRVNNQNQPLIFTVRGNGNSVQTFNVGQWVQNVSQDFKITVNLNTLNPAISHTVALSINGVPFDFDPGPGQTFNIFAARSSQLKQVGYNLTGIDAGTIASDTWKVIRVTDIPPP